MRRRAASCNSTPPASRVYGERDRVNIDELRDRWVFLSGWRAGMAVQTKLREALEQGAAGVQVGTAFAFSRESGMRADLKTRLIEQAIAGAGEVFTDPLASPTGFPFKVAQLDGHLFGLPTSTRSGTRVCDLGYLREPYAAGEDKIGYRCSAEPVGNYLAKGGKIEDTVGRKCLCNALLANIGHAQTRKDGSVEPALITVGDDLNTVAQFLAPGRRATARRTWWRSLLSLSANEPETVLAASA